MNMIIYIATNRLFRLLLRCLLELLAAVSVVGSLARQAGNQVQGRMGLRNEGTTEFQYRAEDLPWGWLSAKQLQPRRGAWDWAANLMRRRSSRLRTKAAKMPSPSGWEGATGGAGAIRPMASSASIELLLERSEGLRALRDMVIAPKKTVFWDTKNRLRGNSAANTAEATDKANWMQPSAFFHFLPFLCGIELLGLPLAKPEAARCGYRRSNCFSF